MRTAVSDTLNIKPLFIFIDLPAEVRRCLSCGQPVRYSITQDRQPVVFNNNATPNSLVQQNGHRYGKFSLNHVHTHEAEAN